MRRAGPGERCTRVRVEVHQLLIESSKQREGEKTAPEATALGTGRRGYHIRGDRALQVQRAIISVPSENPL
jgi:hypothetical protein